MTQHIIELFIELTILLAVYVFARGFDERITVLEEKSSEPKHACGSWPDPYWTKEDYERKDKLMKKCRACGYQGVKTIIIQGSSFQSKIKKEEQRMDKSVKPKRVNK